MMQAKIEKDEVREERIWDEAIVDANGPEEQAMGWYYYLADQITFPFSARCREVRKTSPLQLNETVEVLDMAPAEECEHDMFVMVRWEQRALAVPLAQVEPTHVDETSATVIGDWHYWVDRGYEL